MTPSTHTDHRFNRLTHLAIGVSIAMLIWLIYTLSLLRLDQEVTEKAGAVNLRQLGSYWAASAAVFAALSLLWWRLHREKETSTTQSFTKSTLIIISIAAAARIAVVLTHAPTLSDDIYRYIFDGRNLANGINPYLYTPAHRMGVPGASGSVEDMQIAEPYLTQFDPDTFLAHWSDEGELLPRVNNKLLHTIYLPTSQWVFAAFGMLVSDANSDPDSSTRIFRFGLVAFDLMIIGLILVALRRSNRSPWYAALYAWHPLPLTEIAGSGHQDVIGCFFLVMALLIFEKHARALWRWTIPLALGVLVKPIVLPLTLVMLKGRPLRDWLICASLGAIVCIVLAGPLWFTHAGQPLNNLLNTTARFTEKWSHFGSVYEPMLAVIDQVDPIEDRQIQWQKKETHERIARLICLGLIGAMILIVWIKKLDGWTSARIILFAMVLFSSTAHPWYLLWALVLFPIAPSPTLWVASLTLVWGYAAWGYSITPDGELGWGVGYPIMLLTYIPVYTALTVDLWRRRLKV